MSSKHLWAEEQDEYLRKIVPKKGRVDWTKVMENLNTSFGHKERSAKQCRQRYINYSKFQQRNSETCKWREEQLEILFHQFNKLGPRWNAIAKCLPQKLFDFKFRSGNAIKNRFYGGLRKAIRNMNRMDKQQKGKIKKKLKYESVVRIIEAPQSLSNLDCNLKRQSLQIREKLVDLINGSKELSQKEATTLISQINKFNLSTRSYRTKRRKNIPLGDDNDMIDTAFKDINAAQPSVISSEKSKDPKAQSLRLEARLDEKKLEQNIQYQQAGRPKGNKEAESLDFPILKQVQQQNVANNDQLDSYLLNFFPEQHSPLQNYDLL